MSTSQPHLMPSSLSASTTTSSTAATMSTTNNNNHHQQQQQQQQIHRVTARQQAMNAVEYYNSNIHRVRVASGLARSSVHERHSYHTRNRLNSSGNRLLLPGGTQQSDNLYRSNSSLELVHDQSGGIEDSPRSHYLTGTLRREYGSHGSIDVIAASEKGTVGKKASENFFAMLQEYRPAVLGLQRNAATNGEKDDITDGSRATTEGSPKMKGKFHRLWPNSSSKHISHKQQQQQQVQQSSEDLMNSSVSSVCSVSAQSTVSSSADIEERQRRRAFAHYDCQSLTANLGYAAKLRGLLLARRRNTTTGASAAAMYNTRSSTPDGDSADEDAGDGQNNDLLENCPFFRNEIGGEDEREVSLTRMQNPVPPGQQRKAIHRPSLAYGVSLLECPVGEILWKQITCPFQRGPRPIEQVDHGARYYRNYFLGQEHQNYFGMDEQLGPVAISIKKEKVMPTTMDAQKENQNLFRLIVRTSELLTLRGSVLEEAIPNPRGPGKPCHIKEVLEYVAPEVQISALRLSVNTPQCEQQLLKLDEQGLTNKYKVGILYCRANQATEEDMYNNEDAGPAFVEFLETIGKRVRLKGFEHYKAGLDNKTDSTGTHSVYATYQDCEVMFHVSTMLPFTPNNRQQLLRKRHIGNDIVTIVFQEPGALPFSPKNIRSQFQHVFVIVRVVNPCSENTHYRVAVSRSKEVPVFGPPIRPGALYSRGKNFTDFLLAKIINAENAAHRSEKFATMATRTRQEYLKDLTTNYVTATMVETGQKFSIFPSKKKEKPKPRFSGDMSQRGAFCWQVVLHDHGQSTQVDCFLGISAETFVLIEECSRQIIFVTPCKSILGWSTNGNSLRVYHHQGECVTLNMRDSGERDEQLEVIERLRAVTNGCGALELSLRRNPMGQLGFHVQPDGVVTQVEMSGQAWIAGLRQGYRLVEICKVAVSTLSHDQMVDLLKTSAQVTVTVIESFSDYSPRRGCFLQNCKFNQLNMEGDYADLERCAVDKSSKTKTTPAIQQSSSNHYHRRRYERNFSPPRSSNSSGYGTGSSSRSFIENGVHHQNSSSNTKYVPDMGTLTSSSSGHSSNDERWYDVLEVPEESLPPTTNNNYHQRVHHANSVPTSVNNRPLSLHENRVYVKQPTMEYIPVHGPKGTDYIGSEVLLQSLHINENDGNTHQSSKNPSPQEEPIYNGSNKSVKDDDDHSSSPRLTRSATTNSIHFAKKSSSSSSSSRNNSPRPNVEAAKLRPGAANRNAAHHQRSSVNFANSTLQEDLIKLITGATSNDDNFHNGPIREEKPKKDIPNSHSLGNISLLQQQQHQVTVTNGQEEQISKNKSKSREEIQASEEVIFTTARPATVISTNKAPDLNKLVELAEEKLKMSPRKSLAQSMLKNGTSTNNNEGDALKLPHLPDINDLDWNTLVDTATRAIMQQSNGDHRSNGTSNHQQPHSHTGTPMHHGHTNGHDIYEEIHRDTNTPDSTSSLGNGNEPQMVSSTSLPELQTQVCHLSERVLREQRRRRSLEQAVRRLTEENRRLQDESQAAVQQLRRFTEWFFQTIDKQSQN
ncbi:signal-induced proliferation-associated 1-like protein 1 [Culicoides brevitarsis]|uniref:signal-induced proliferation-associated 1-like protein 1 n=1 Tax=Culicoides brevitarsis TaxID=469753 RepID=UPI00307C8FD4